MRKTNVNILLAEMLESQKPPKAIRLRKNAIPSNFSDVCDVPKVKEDKEFDEAE